MPVEVLIKVLIIEDSIISLTGLEQIIGTGGDMEVVATAADGSAALEAAARTRPDVALLDTALRTGGGVDLVRRLLALPEPPRVLVLTAAHDEDSVREALTGGACGYLLKDLTIEDLLAGIRSAHAGHAVLDPQVTRALVDSLREAGRAASGDLRRLSVLTRRERAVLRLLALGLTNAAIGERLGLSEATVKSQVARSCGKLGLANRVQLAGFVSRVDLDMGPGGD